MYRGGVVIAVSRMRQHTENVNKQSYDYTIYIYTLIEPNDIARWIILTFLSGRSDQLQPVRPRLLTLRLTYTTSTAATIEWTMIRLLFI